MMQKGKVVSEEFNRQIGEQIPGNAVIGAQALSKLEGRFVSVAEFFQRMQRGLIISKTFVPAYAPKLEKTYGPLLEIAKIRPDVALNRLRNAFQLFAKRGRVKPASCRARHRLRPAAQEDRLHRQGRRRAPDAGGAEARRNSSAKASPAWSTCSARRWTFAAQNI
jgi:hypothetical protein